MGDSMSIYFSLFIASFIWGSNVVLMKLLLNDIPFMLLAFLRVFLSGIFLFIYMLYYKKSFSKTFLKSIVIGILGIYLNFYFTFIGINQVNGVDTALLNALSPVFTFLFSIIILKNKLQIKELICLCLCLLSYCLSIQFDFNKLSMGILYLISGLICYSLSNVLIQKWKIEKSVGFVLNELCVGSVCLFVHCLFANQFDLSYLYNMSLVSILLFLFVSCFGFCYIQVTYLKAIQSIGSFKTSFFMVLNPLVTYLESLVFLHETINYFHVLCFIIIVISIIYMNKNLIKNKS